MRRWVLVALSSTLALVMLAVFSLMAPPPARPVKPTELEPEVARERARPAHFDEPVRPAEPPPAPEVANDPARGVVWLRVIDFDTNMPLALRRCELCEVETVPSEKPTSEFWWREAVKLSSEFFWREVVTLSTEVRDFEDTDAHGLLSFKVPSDKFTFFGRVRYGDKLEWKYPLPPAFEPVTHPDTVAAAIAALKAAPQTRPIDVQVRAAPRVQGRVWDPEGRPAAGAEVFAWPVEVAPELDALARCVSEHYEWLRASPAGDDVYVDAETSLKLLDEDGVTGGEPPASGEERKLARRFGIGNLAGHFRANTDRNGRYTLPPLLRGRWMICARSEASATSTRRCHLSRMDNEVDFSLPPKPGATLRVTAEFTGTLQPADWLFFRVASCSPSGAEAYKGGTSRSETLLGSDRTATFAGLAPGCYAITVVLERSGESSANGSLIWLSSGGSTEVVVPVGPQAMGEWRPAVAVDGVFLKTVHALIHGAAHHEPQEIETTGMVQTGQLAGTGMALPSGEYTAYMPGMDPQKFTIRPGVPSATLWGVKASRATFTIEQEFAARALGRSGKAILALSPRGEMARLASKILAEVNGLESTSTIPLSVAQDLELKLFVGEFDWTLYSDNRNFSGTLSVDARGGNSFRFGLGQMPGLARLDIDASGLVASGEESPTPSVDLPRGSALRISAPPSGRAGQAPWREQEQHPYVFDLGEGRFVAFAKAGYYEVAAAGAPVLARIPGRVVLAQGKSSSLVRVTLAGPREKGTRLEARVLDVDGQPHTLFPGALIHVKAGGLSVSGFKEVYSSAKGVEGSYCTGGYVEITGDTTLDLSGWQWMPYGSFSLTCEGRNAPGQSRHPWWSSTDGWKSVRVVCTNRGDMFGPAEVALFDVDDWMPEGRAAFTFNNRSVPPGRYKVIPWPGAAEEYCEVFEVESGKHASVTLNTG